MENSNINKLKDYNRLIKKFNFFNNTKTDTNYSNSNISDYKKQEIINKEKITNNTYNINNNYNNCSNTINSDISHHANTNKNANSNIKSNVSSNKKDNYTVELFNGDINTIDTNNKKSIKTHNNISNPSKVSFGLITSENDSNKNSNSYEIYKDIKNDCSNIITNKKSNNMIYDKERKGREINERKVSIIDSDNKVKVNILNDERDINDTEDMNISIYNIYDNKCNIGNKCYNDNNDKHNNQNLLNKNTGELVDPQIPANNANNVNNKTINITNITNITNINNLNNINNTNTTTNNKKITVRFSNDAVIKYNSTNLCNNNKNKSNINSSKNPSSLASQTLDFGNSNYINELSNLKDYHNSNSYSNANTYNDNTLNHNENNQINNENNRKLISKFSTWNSKVNPFKNDNTTFSSCNSKLNKSKEGSYNNNNNNNNNDDNNDNYNDTKTLDTNDINDYTIMNPAYILNYNNNNNNNNMNIVENENTKNTIKENKNDEINIHDLDASRDDNICYIDIEMENQNTKVNRNDIIADNKGDSNNYNYNNKIIHNTSSRFNQLDKFDATYVNTVLSSNENIYDIINNSNRNELNSSIENNSKDMYYLINFNINNSLYEKNNGERIKEENNSLYTSGIKDNIEDNYKYFDNLAIYSKESCDIVSSKNMVSSNSVCSKNVNSRVSSHILKPKTNSLNYNNIKNNKNDKNNNYNKELIPLNNSQKKQIIKSDSKYKNTINTHNKTKIKLQKKQNNKSIPNSNNNNINSAINNNIHSNSNSNKKKLNLEISKLTTPTQSPETPYSQTNLTVYYINDDQLHSKKAQINHTKYKQKEPKSIQNITKNIEKLKSTFCFKNFFKKVSSNIFPYFLTFLLNNNLNSYFLFNKQIANKTITKMNDYFHTIVKEFKKTFCCLFIIEDFCYDFKTKEINSFYDTRIIQKRNTVEMKIKLGFCFSEKYKGNRSSEFKGSGGVKGVKGILCDNCQFSRLKLGFRDLCSSSITFSLVYNNLFNRNSGNFQSLRFKDKSNKFKDCYNSKDYVCVKCQGSRLIYKKDEGYFACKCATKSINEDDYIITWKIDLSDDRKSTTWINSEAEYVSKARLNINIYMNDKHNIIFILHFFSKILNLTSSIIT